MRETLMKQLEKYIPFNEQEERDKEMILQALRTQQNIFSRDISRPNPLCRAC